MYKAVEAAQWLWDVVYDDDEVVGSICQKADHFTAYTISQDAIGQSRSLGGAVELVTQNDLAVTNANLADVVSMM